MLGVRNHSMAETIVQLSAINHTADLQIVADFSVEFKSGESSVRAISEIKNFFNDHMRDVKSQQQTSGLFFRILDCVSEVVVLLQQGMSIRVG